MTGLSQEQLDLLIDRVADQVGTWQPPVGRHRALDLRAAVTMTLVWLRHNLSQALLGAFYDISQPTVSRIIARLRELITGAANQQMPGLADTAADERVPAADRAALRPARTGALQRQAAPGRDECSGDR